MRRGCCGRPRRWVSSNHPNVVTVHDVGTRAEDVWVAMEFVAGRTVGAWLKERRRTWREVVAVLRPAAVGLAAAHEAGLVHRDVKPDNVMLGDDGRVRVMDFGLARGAQIHTDERQGDQDSDDTQARPRRRHLDVALTQMGATPGTPAYMAPEQIAGEATDARSDQFSYCVMLWEALYGQRPFEGSTLVELANNVLEGNCRPPPPGVRTPRWLRVVMQRGLAVERRDRWPSLTTLLSALDRGRRRSRAYRTLGGVAVVVLAGTAALSMQRLQERRTIAACEADAAAIDEAWNDAEREAVRAGLVATGAGYAAVTADKVMPWLDDYAEGWRGARAQACLNVEVSGRWDTEMLDRSTWCLDDRWLQLRAVVDELSSGHPRTVSKAVHAVAGLPRVDPCLDGDLQSRLPAPPATNRDAVQAIRIELARAAALRSTGAYEDGLTAARRSEEQANKLGWPPLVAATRVRVGELLERTAAYDQAEAVLEEAYFEALTSGALEDALSAAHQLVFVVGDQLARPEDGERWFKHAEVLRAALRDPAGLREATGLNHFANVRAAADAHDQAVSLLERAVVLREQALGQNHPSVATLTNNLARVRYETGAYEEAAALHTRALAILERALGRNHPTVGHVLHNLAAVRVATGARKDGAALYLRALATFEESLGANHPYVARTLSNLAALRHETGEDDEAAALLERALAIQEHALGHDHPDLAVSLTNLAVVRRATGAYEEALKHLERALAIQEGAVGRDHSRLAPILDNLGNLRAATGEFEEAAALHHRALAIREATLGHDHADVATSLNNLGALRWKTGAHSRAATYYQRALAIREKAVGPDHPHLAYSLVGLARIELLQDRPAEAEKLARRAVQLREAGGASPMHLAKAQFVLSRALVASGGDRSRAVALAERARNGFRAAGEPANEQLAEVERWLADLAEEH